MLSPVWATAAYCGHSSPFRGIRSCRRARYVSRDGIGLLRYPFAGLLRGNSSIKIDNPNTARTLNFGIFKEALVVKLRIRRRPSPARAPSSAPAPCVSRVTAVPAAPAPDPPPPVCRIPPSNALGGLDGPSSIALVNRVVDRARRARSSVCRSRCDYDLLSFKLFSNREPGCGWQWRRDRRRRPVAASAVCVDASTPVALPSQLSDDGRRRRAHTHGAWWWINSFSVFNKSGGRARRSVSV